MTRSTLRLGLVYHDIEFPRSDVAVDDNSSSIFKKGVLGVKMSVCFERSKNLAHPSRLSHRFQASQTIVPTVTFASNGPSSSLLIGTFLLITEKGEES